jgi:hypothetical protein
MRKRTLEAGLPLGAVTLLGGNGLWLLPPDPDRDPGTRKRQLFEKISEPLPSEMLALAATTQPRVPGPLRRLDEQQQTTEISADAEDG